MSVFRTLNQKHGSTIDNYAYQIKFNLDKSYSFYYFLITPLAINNHYYNAINLFNKLINLFKNNK